MFTTTNVQLIVAGDGSELLNVKTMIDEENISNIIFVGYVRGSDKATVYKNSDLYLFPSYHREGMPNSVLEAMAFGLPVVTNSVGGLVDFFEQERMGYMLDSYDPEKYAKCIKYLHDNPGIRKEMGVYNYYYAKKHFYASTVAKRLEKIYEAVIS